MVDKIVNIADFRKKAKPTVQSLMVNCITSIMTDWEKFARNNCLNDFFTSSIPSWSDPKVNYLDDLNAVSKLENRLQLPVMVKAPHGVQMGWIAGFPLKNQMVLSPELAFETYARCFNIILFLKLKRELLAAGVAEEL